jgi:hypothetical protein
MECTDMVPRGLFKELFQLSTLHIYLLTLIIILWVITLYIAFDLKGKYDRVKIQQEHRQNQRQRPQLPIVVVNDSYETHNYETVV